MSVINTMLKDLEKRGGNAVAGDEVLRGLSSAVRSDARVPSGGNYYLVGVLGIMVVALVLVILYLTSPYQLVVASGTEQVMEPVSVSDKPHTTPPVQRISKPVETVKPFVAEAPKTVMPEVTKTVVPEEVATTNQQDLAQLQVTASNIKSKESKPVQRVAKKEAVAVETMAVVSPQEDIAEEETETDQVISKTQREPSGEEKSRVAYLNALSMYNRGRVQESRALLKDALNYDAYNLNARKLLASIYLREGQPAIALTVIEKGLNGYSDNQELLRLYLQTQAQLGNYAEAITILEQRLKPNTPEDIAYLAGLYQKNNGHLNAVELYSRALQLMPAKSVWWMGQGISFEALSQQEEALKSYQQSIASGQLSSQLAGYVMNRISAIKQIQLKSAS